MKILAIETSCDETAAAVVEDGIKVISNVVSSSADLHEKYGGIVPEVAARKQVECIVPVIEQVLGGGSIEEIDFIAVTVGPGLMGSLVVGIAAAETIALVSKKPIIPVNHLVGHVYANWVGREEKDFPEFPATVLIVSGGHTDLILMKDHGAFEYLGGTLDDAVGEAFDKTARLLGIKKYLGGSELSKVASKCKENTMQNVLPRPKIKDNDYDFSFSGLKTAVRRIVENNEYKLDSLACEFETAAVDVLVNKTVKAAKECNVKSILIGGGVSANKQLRARLKSESEHIGVKLYVPPVELCTDNAVYIASAAYFNQNFVDLDKVVPNPSLGVVD